jgi:hypothetical protein
MSDKIHDCGYVFPRFIEIGTVPTSVLDKLEKVIAHVECPRCKAHVDLTVIVAITVSGGKVLQ